MVTQRDVDKTPVMELLQRLSDSEPPLDSQQQLTTLQLRTVYYFVIIILLRNLCKFIH